MILVRASRELVADSANVNTVLSDVFSGTIASALDEGILFGSNSSGEMNGLTNYSIAEVDMGTNGAQLTNYDPLVEAYRKMLDNNSVSPSAYIMAPREWETLATLKDSQNRYLDRPQALDGIPFYDSTNIPVNESHGTANNASRIVTGDWNDLVIGFRNEMRIELLRERYADSYQYGFLVHMRVDAVPARDESFAQITGIIPDSGT
jgi:HK97 family phage major capsid protein